MRWFGLNPFTEGSYLLCLRLALVYPILGLLVIWLLGGEGALAGITLLPALESEWLRILAAGLPVLFGFLVFKGFRSEGWRSLIYLLEAFVGVGVGVGVGAVASKSIRDRLDSNRQIARYWLGFNLFYVGLVLLVLAWALPQADDPEPLLIPVFLVLLPLANVALDWLSLGFTRGFLYAIERRHHTGLVVLMFAGFDILLALLFLFLIASLTTLLLSLLNLATVAWGGSPLLDLQLLFNGLAQEPGALEFAWIHFMMLSTLIPTLIHFLVAGFTAVLVLSEGRRRWILDNWDLKNPHKE